MGTSNISITRSENKWRVVRQDLISLAETEVEGESYDDEHTAKLAGIILAKIQGLSFLDVPKEINT